MEMFQVMDPDGKVDKNAIKDISEDDILTMYRWMVFSRKWDAKALSLQRQGRLGTIASIRGQEASNIGPAMALGPNDWYVPAFRESGGQLVVGYNPEDLMAYWGGDEEGMKPPEGKNVMPTCITVGSHLVHGAGIAFAAKIRGDDSAVLTSSGDGSTSQGDFHTALNFAGVYELPIVFVIQNNQWAISVPRSKQTASETLAEKADVYGFKGRLVDGNDIFAVYLTIKELLDQARSDHKPSLVELYTYRMGDHTTSDDAGRYRTDEMVEPWRDKDPIDRLRTYMEAELGWNEEKESEMDEELTGQVEEAVKKYENKSHPEPKEMFDYTFQEMPWHVREERAELLEHLGEEE